MSLFSINNLIHSFSSDGQRPSVSVETYQLSFHMLLFYLCLSSGDFFIFSVTVSTFIPIFEKILFIYTHLQIFQIKQSLISLSILFIITLLLS